MMCIQCVHTSYRISSLTFTSHFYILIVWENNLQITLKLVDLDHTSTRMTWQIMMGWPHPPAGTRGTLESSKCEKTQLAEGLRSSSSQIPHPEARRSPLSTHEPLLNLLGKGSSRVNHTLYWRELHSRVLRRIVPRGSHVEQSLPALSALTLVPPLTWGEMGRPWLPWSTFPRRRAWVPTGTVVPPYPFTGSGCVRPALSQCLVGVCAAGPDSKQPSAPLFPGCSSPAGLSHSAPLPPPHSFPWGALSFTCSWQDMKSASFGQLAGYGAWSSRGRFVLFPQMSSLKFSDLFLHQAWEW